MIDTARIRETIKDPSVVAGLFCLKITGGKVRCPVHKEKTPSCSVSCVAGRFVFFCHGCGAHGDIFEFTQAAKGCSFREAGEFLSAVSNIPDTEKVEIQSFTPPPPKYLKPESASRAWGRVSPLPDGVFAHRFSADFHTNEARWTHRGPRNIIIPLFRPNLEIGNFAQRSPRDLAVKTKTLKGYSAKGLCFLNEQARKGADVYLITEGETDFLLCSWLFPSLAVVGVRSGSMSADWSGFFGREKKIVIATDQDTAGEKYHQEILDNLKGNGHDFTRRKSPVFNDLSEEFEQTGTIENVERR